MKTITLLGSLLFACTCFSQSQIYEKSGKVTQAKHMDLHPKKSFIKAEINGNHQKISLANIDSIRRGSTLIKPLADGKKMRLYAVLATSGTKILAVSKTDAVKSRGGFESIQSNYELVVSENGAVSKKLHFSNSKIPKEIEKRRQIFPFLEADFGNCPDIVSQFSLFRNASDPSVLTILNYFDAPGEVNCK